MNLLKLPVLGSRDFLQGAGKLYLVIAGKSPLLEGSWAGADKRNL